MHLHDFSKLCQPLESYGQLELKLHIKLKSYLLHSFSLQRISVSLWKVIKKCRNHSRNLNCASKSPIILLDSLMKLSI